MTIVASFSAVAVQAKEYYISASTGDDANAGTKEMPFKSIKAAAEKTEPGSTLTVLPGWYEGGIILKPGAKENPTVLRAAEKGRVFIGRAELLGGFQKVPGLEYTYSAKVNPLPSVTEMDTGFSLRSVASVVDVEELAGGFYYDTEAETAYVHPGDSAGVAHHLYASTRSGENGITFASNTVVDGFALAGFGNAAIKGAKCDNATVQNCITYLNGYGIYLEGGNDCVIRGNEAWANRPGYDQGGQIHVAGVVQRILVENNTVHNGSQFGIRFYGDGATECMTRGNLVYDNGDTGFYYKCKGDSATQAAERNVGFGNKTGQIEAAIMTHNTYSSYATLQAGKPGVTDLDVAKLGADPKFADAAYRDYRLQSDSPARKKAPDGSDLGAFPYEGSVLYVKPDGNDKAAGTSRAEAWKTIAHAMKNLKPGQTLYIEGENWNEPLVVNGIKSAADKPVVLRAYGKANVQFEALTVSGCENLRVEGVRAKGGGIQVLDSSNIGLLRCISSNGKDAGLSITKSSGVAFDHGALTDNAGGGIKADADSADISLISTILRNNGKSDIDVPENSPGFYSNFNAFSGDLHAWRKKSGQDADSIAIPAEEFAGRGDDDFRVRAGQSLAISGRYAQPIGPSGVFISESIVRKSIERIEVLSTTRTSANVTYWTPGQRVGTVIEWGQTSKYGKKLDRADGLIGEFETFHTISLIGLDPDTEYHFRVGFCSPVDGKYIWSEDRTFRTAKKDPAPRRLYVSLEGDDTNDGLSPSKPWRTLHKAAREARAGDTVTIAPGRYMEMLRPLQTGTAPDNRITFRAERPLTVTLEGGMIKFQRDGRANCILVQSKAFLTFENLVCERVSSLDNGGYRGGRGYSGLVGISGSAGIDIKNCLLDGRARWMPCIWAFEAGKMPSVPPGVRGFTVTDSILLNGWRGLGYSAVRPCEVRNCLLARSLTTMITELGSEAKLILRNNIITSIIINKAMANGLWGRGYLFDFDYNCYVWDDENPNRFILDKTPGGLVAWREKSKQDMHSIEIFPGMPFLKRLGFGPGGDPKLKDSTEPSPIAIEEIILPADSPARTAGENGEIIGPRWDKWLPKKE